MALSESEEFEFRARAESEGHIAPAPAATTGAATAEQIPGYTPVEKAAEPSWLEKLTGAGEAGLSAITGITAPLEGGASAIANLVAGRGPQAAGEAFRRVSEQGQYDPRTEAGQSMAASASDFMGNLPPVIPEIPSLGRLPARQAAATARAGGSPEIASSMRSLKSGVARPPKALSGVGAAETPAAAQRRAQASGLDVPLSLTKGQAERTLGQQRFERETAGKQEEIGKPIRQLFAEQTQKVLQNFDAWVDQVGAKAPDLRSTGKAVDKALAQRVASAKTKINNAYEAAKAAGEMEAPVQVTPLVDYLKKHEPEAINAPVLTSVASKLQQLAAGDGRLSINGLEEIRKMVNRIAEPGTPNSVFGKEVKGIIDQITEGAGGEKYQAARKLRREFAKEFEDHGVVSKMLSTKPGTADRSVAFEDVFKHSILNGSTDDVKIMRNTLQRGGTEGAQAWKELQGATINHLKDLATKSVERDEFGNTVISPAAFHKAMTVLDREGKLDAIFGKQGAQKIRDLDQVVIDAFTAPGGAVNRSNTSSAMLSAIKGLSSIASRLHLSPVSWVVEKGIKASEEQALKKRVREALPPQEQP